MLQESRITLYLLAELGAALQVNGDWNLEPEVHQIQIPTQANQAVSSNQQESQLYLTVKNKLRVLDHEKDLIEKQSIAITADSINVDISKNTK